MAIRRRKRKPGVEVLKVIDVLGDTMTNKAPHNPYPGLIQIEKINDR
jgi:hypothetical protein